MPNEPISLSVLTQIIGWAVLGGIGFGASRAGAKAGLNGTKLRVESLERRQERRECVEGLMSADIAALKADVSWIRQEMQASHG